MAEPVEAMAPVKKEKDIHLALIFLQRTLCYHTTGVVALSLGMPVAATRTMLEKLRIAGAVHRITTIDRTMAYWSIAGCTDVVTTGAIPSIGIAGTSTSYR